MSESAGAIWELSHFQVLYAVATFLLSKSCGYISSDYGSMFFGNRLVRTRMPGGVGAGGENPPATRLGLDSGFDLTSSQIKYVTISNIANGCSFRSPQEIHILLLNILVNTSSTI
ncbi:MAG: hypothetical protein Q7W05_00140, partial [Deltaproteobacteria bacterium]|nr:hypothetical protein [Deltaproteobacteria bacterium]